MSERILIGDDITITVVRIGPNSVRIGIDAPEEMSIKRPEAETNKDNGQCTT
jgi:carbon storage regulator